MQLRAGFYEGNMIH